MKKISLFLFFVLCTILAQSQQFKGLVFYQNVDSVKKIMNFYSQKGMSVFIAPRVISLDKNKNIQKVLKSYQDYFSEFYVQVNSLSFLDSENFEKLDKKNLKIQKVLFEKSKFTDYKFDGWKSFDLPYVQSDVYFTATVFEYSDKYLLDITIAEKIKTIN